jgi:hypothetical protein
MTFPKREIENNNRTEETKVELSTEELAAIDGGLVVVGGGPVVYGGVGFVSGGFVAGGVCF